MSRLTVACAALLLFAAGSVSAQEWKAPDPKAEPWRDARLKLGRAERLRLLLVVQR